MTFIKMKKMTKTKKRLNKFFILALAAINSYLFFDLSDILEVLFV